MRQSTKLILNTGIVYGRMAIGFVIGLLLTRQILGELGEIDYGLFLSVGAAWALLNIFINSLHGSGQRHLAHALGSEDHDAARSTFSCLCLANWLLAAGVAIVGVVFSGVVLNGLDIPAGRETAALYVYCIGFAALTIMVAMAPFTAALLANQKFMTIAVFDLTERVLMLIAAYGMFFYEGDKLIYWSIAYATLQLSIGVAKSFYTARTLPWARFAASQLNWADTKEILFFSNWMLIGHAVMRMRMQGSLLIFNYFFGNAVAAAQGTAMQLATYQNQLTSALTQTVRPMLTGQFARGDHNGFRSLTLTYCKFTTLAAALLGIVMLVETDCLLNLWLKKVPPYAEEIVWWTLVLFLLNRLSVGYMVAMECRGELAGVTLFVRLPELLFIVPMIGYMLLVPSEPWHVPAAFVVVNGILTLVVLPLYVGRRIGLAARTWLFDVAIPVLLVLALAYAAVWSLGFTSLPDLARLVVGMLMNVAIISAGGWLLVLNANERRIIGGFANAARNKLRRNRTPIAASGTAEANER